MLFVYYAALYIIISKLPNRCQERWYLHASIQAMDITLQERGRVFTKLLEQEGATSASA